MTFSELMEMSKEDKMNITIAATTKGAEIKTVFMLKGAKIYETTDRNEVKNFLRKDK